MSQKMPAANALPYADGPLHLGHVLEAIPTGIWVHYHRNTRQEIYYVCADGAHGAPVMLRAKAGDGITMTLSVHRQTGIGGPSPAAQMHPSLDAGAFSIARLDGRGIVRLMAGGAREPQGSPALKPACQPRTVRRHISGPQYNILCDGGGGFH